LLFRTKAPNPFFPPHPPARASLLAPVHVSPFVHGIAAVSRPSPPCAPWKKIFCFGYLPSLLAFSRSDMAMFLLSLGPDEFRRDICQALRFLTAFFFASAGDHLFSHFRFAPFGGATGEEELARMRLPPLFIRRPSKRLPLTENVVCPHHVFHVPAELWRIICCMPPPFFD